MRHLQRKTLHGKPKKACVYVIQCQRFFKIGVATNLVKRLSSMQSGNPFELSVIWFIESDDAEFLEYTLHQRYMHVHVRGEWFFLQPEDIQEIMNEFPLTELHTSSE